MPKEIYKLYNDVNDDILSLRTRVFIDEQNVPQELEIDYNEFDYIHCCLYLDEKLIAYLRYRINENKVAHIGRVCVDKNYRKMNFGKKIMLFAEEEIKKQMGEVIELGAQVQAKTFYQKLGYKEFGDEFLDAGIIHIAMKKVLTKNNL